MSSEQDFDALAHRYERDSSVQKAASEILFDLLAIGTREVVLDLGCGPGHLTRRIGDLTEGRVLGVDPSPSMIEQARAKYPGARIRFEVGSAEELAAREEFDAIFCNSAFQWIRDPARALRACRAALRPGGRMGIQAPATARFCPNFLDALEVVTRDPSAGPALAGFANPWLFRETPEEYAALFESAGFQVLLSRMEEARTQAEPEEVMRIFESGAAAGYLNGAHYRSPLPPGWAERVRAILRSAFAAQAKADGRVDLAFRRVYLIARRE